MKKAALLHVFGFLFFLVAAQSVQAQKPVNWTSDQLMEPQQLAKLITENKKVPVIIHVGPGALIPHSIDARPAEEKENLDGLRKQLSAMPKNTSIVVYCGCCPFDHCPNVRPAIGLLKEMKFTNYKLLNLPQNLKTDWLDKGYPRIK